MRCLVPPTVVSLLSRDTPCSSRLYTLLFILSTFSDHAGSVLDDDIHLTHCHVALLFIRCLYLHGNKNQANLTKTQRILMPEDRTYNNSIGAVVCNRHPNLS